MSISTAASTVKTHVKKHKEAYVVGAVATGVIVVGAVIAFKSGVVTLNVTDSANIAINSPKTNVVNNITNVAVSNGHLSKIVQNVDTGEWFASQAEAARAIGVDPSAISRHFSRGEKLPDGVQLIRRGVAS
jgi:hypothetical protein